MFAGAQSVHPEVHARASVLVIGEGPDLHPVALPGSAGAGQKVTVEWVGAGDMLYLDRLGPGPLSSPLNFVRV